MNQCPWDLQRSGRPYKVPSDPEIVLALPSAPAHQNDGVVELNGARGLGTGAVGLV